ncbi:hypothetical protein HK105_200259 [Polyrhizophydium stewartii]|uniref:Protein kinase domain-containing protein n=1 Tax=Polyrhizophydium stewartii TaxID=2732419 RepID=A0ABR4NKY7_9FUNG
MTQKLGEGTFSEVLKVKHKVTGKVYAMKRFRKRFNRSVPSLVFAPSASRGFVVDSTFEEIQNLREIQALRRLNPHNHVIDLIEVIFRGPPVRVASDQKHGVLALNFELMDCNLYELISRKNVIITETKAKNYFYQICRGLEYMHSKGIFHRDIKPENILIKDNTIKLADFGSCRGIHSKQPYTEYIATRWYRSPECLLCDGIYNFKMDIWGAGCVLYEIISKVPLFPGSNELDQLHRIHAVLGTPNQKLLKKMLGNRSSAPEYNFPPKEGTGIRALLPHVTADCVDLVNAMLQYDPDLRINAREVLKHPFFKDLQYNDANLSKSEASLTKALSATTLRAKPEVRIQILRAVDDDDDDDDGNDGPPNPYLKRAAPKGDEKKLDPDIPYVVHQTDEAYLPLCVHASATDNRQPHHAPQPPHMPLPVGAKMGEDPVRSHAPYPPHGDDGAHQAQRHHEVTDEAGDGTHGRARQSSQQPPQILVQQQQSHRTQPIQVIAPPPQHLQIQQTHHNHQHHAQQQQQQQPYMLQHQQPHAQTHTHVDNSDAVSVVSTTSTNATNTTTMSATYYNMVKQQADERLSLEVAMARARRAKKKSGASDSRGSKRGSASNMSLSRKASWSHGTASMPSKKTQPKVRDPSFLVDISAATQLPVLNVTQAAGFKELREAGSGKAKLDPRGANLPLLSISSMNAEKRKDGAKGKQDFVTLPSLASDKAKMDATLSVGLAVGNTTSLPAIKPRKDFH